MRRVLRAALLVILPASLAAQGTVIVRGVAYDSVAMRPLAGAMITLNAVRTAFADARGVFGFDSVTPGTHLVEMTHPMLDSMGLPGVATRVQVSDGAVPIVVALPSFATLWRAACGNRRAPADSGFVYGTVRSARDGRDVSGAGIELSWSDFAVENIRSVTGKRYRAETETDANGEYSVCGVPLDAGMRVQAKRADLVSATLDLMPTRLRIFRRDLLLGPADTADVTARGMISGAVRNAQGAAFEGATIVLDDVPQVRTGADGRFTLPNVLPGSHQVEVLGIGVRPQLFVVDVVAGQPVDIVSTLERVTQLDAVRVIGSPWQVRLLEAIEGRKRTGFAKFIDSTLADRMPSMGSLVSTVPGLRVRPTGANSQAYQIAMLGPNGRECTPNVLIDGRRSDIEMLQVLGTHEIGVIEIYSRAPSVPSELQQGVSSCGMIVVWTKRMMP